jgi:hypothetical protein
VGRNRLRVKGSKSPAITITRSAFQHDKLVYVGCVNRRLRYPRGRSRIAYIGMTKVGAKRIAASAASRGLTVLQRGGVRQLEFYRVTCQRRRNLRSWAELERALLITFVELYGSVPFSNKHGRKMKSEDKPSYFSESRLRNVLRQYA